MQTPEDRIDRHQRICETEAFWGIGPSETRPQCRGGLLGSEVVRSSHNDSFQPVSTAEIEVEPWIRALAES